MTIFSLEVLALSINVIYSKLTDKVLTFVFVIVLVLECMLQRVIVVVDAGRICRIPHIVQTISQLQILLQLLNDPGSLSKFFLHLVRIIIFEHLVKLLLTGRLVPN